MNLNRVLQTIKEIQIKIHVFQESKLLNYFNTTVFFYLNIFIVKLCEFIIRSNGYGGKRAVRVFKSMKIKFVISNGIRKYSLFYHYLVLEKSHYLSVIAQLFYDSAIILRLIFSFSTTEVWWS